jgi:hypothetical protein
MDNLHKLDNEAPVEHDDPAPATKHYTIDQAIADVLATLDTADDTGAKGITDEAFDAPFPDPFTGDHNIEYWIWTGGRLVPASPDQSQRLRRQEALEEEEFRSRRERQRAYRQQRWQSCSQVMQRLLAPLHNMGARLKDLNSQ